jgi:hypothetical protein
MEAGMESLWDPGLEVVVEAGRLYLPLLFDPEVAREVEAGAPGAIRRQGRWFVQAVTVDSLLAHYADLFPGAYAHWRQAALKNLAAGRWLELAQDPRLEVILFGILPHFMRRPGRSRKPWTRLAVLKTMVSRVPIPPRHLEEARAVLRPGSLQGLLHDLEMQRTPLPPLAHGPMAARAFMTWLRRALESRFLEEECRLLREALGQGTPGGEAGVMWLAVLSYLATQGALEVDGCGVMCTKNCREFVIYRRTGEYALKDYYARLYLFPDCRVAVATHGPLAPVVLERYKHPFLMRHAPGQAVCVGDFRPAKSFGAAQVIRALEEGLNALRHGYDPRRRRGYHRLDGFRDLDHTVTFDEFRIPRDHPKLISGAVAVTNDYR